MTFQESIEYMPIEDLLLEQERLQGQYMHFQFAERSYYDKHEAKRRNECEAQLRDISTELARRKAKADKIKQNIK